MHFCYIHFGWLLLGDVELLGFKSLLSSVTFFFLCKGEVVGDLNCAVRHL